MYEQAEPATAWQAILEETGGDTDMAASVVDDMIADKEAAVKKAEKAKPKHADTVAGKIAAQKERKAAIERAKAELEAWKKIAAAKAVHDDAVAERKSAEAKRQDEQLHEAAVAQAEQDKAEKRRKEEEQKTVGTHAVNPKIKKKWDESNKIEGNANVIVLPDGSKLRGHYVLTEAGAATASHDASNGFEPTEGFPVDENGQSVNDRDYSRDKDAQRMVDEMANGFDSRALQSPVIVSQDGVVLSGNNRTMSGDIAAKQGTDKAYVDHLREFGQMYGFAPEQIDGMQHPRVVFVPDEPLPYDAATFARFNAETQKRQSKPEHAVKLGKIVPDNVFGSIATAIGGYDRLSDFYADSNAVNEVLKRLFDAGVINEMQLPELRTGNALSAAGKELIENLLVGKAFQDAPDAVRQLIAEPNVKQAVVMALSEIAHNRTLEKSGYSLGKELAAAIDLVYRARRSNPDMYKNGVPVSPFGRQLGLFDGQGDQAVTDGTVLLLADLLSSGKTSDLRKVLAAYNAEATESASGQADIFSGKVLSKEEILKTVTEHFKNATRGEQKKLVDAAVDKRKQAAAERGGRGKESEQTEHAAERGEKGGSREPARGGTAADGGLPERQGDLAETREVKLSDKTDNNGHHFVLASDGSEEFGEITEDSGLTAAPIKLSEGFNYVDENGKNHGYGLRHMNVGDRRKQILDGGFHSVLGFVEYVTKNYKEIRIGRKREGNQTYMLLEVHDEKHKCSLYVELSNDGTYWNVNSGGIFKNKYTDKNDAVWPEPTVGSSANTDTTEVVDSPTEVAKGETVDRGGNSSQTASEDKDNTKPATTQEGGGKSAVAVKEKPKKDDDDGPDGPTGGKGKPKGGGRPDSQTYKVDNQGNPIDNEEETPLSEQIATASADVNTEPTEGQKEAGNYKKGHVQVGTFNITIEQPKGSVRKGTDANGKQWESKMHNTYGYFRGTEGVDGDHIDVFLSNDIDGWNGRKVYVVDQYNPDGTFDEHKVMLGFNDQDEAKGDYLANYEKGWENGRRIDVSAVNLEDFEKWIGSSHRKTKPFGEYSSVKKDVVEINAPANEDTPSEIQTLLRERGCTPISQEHRNLTDEGVVADNAGNPIILYHGTLDKSISVSELEAGHKRVDGESADFAGSGVYFTPNKDVAEEYGYNGQVFEAHVKLSKPFYMLGNPDFNESESVQFSNLLKSKGYDGIINYMNAWSVEHNMIDGGEVVVFNNSSILPIEKGQNNHAGYSITPTTYTNKKGKTTDMSLLKFDNELTPEQERAVKEFAKERTGEGRFAPTRGWKDRESGGWIFRSEEDARKAAEMVGSDEAVADNQPLTAQELREAVGPKKPVARNEAAASKPANKVEIADVVEQPNEPTKAAEPAKEEKPQYEVSDEEMQGLMNDIRDILGIDDSEGDSGMLFRDPDELTPKERQKLMSVGQRLAMALVERGNESFGEYAIAMVSALGSKVRPWLKAFYGGLEYVPGYEKYALTPYDEVKAFDVENFDKPHNSGPLKQAQMMVEEGKAQTTAAKANNELKEIRNEQRKETEKQTAADTDAVAAEAETDISEAETHETTSGDRRAVSGAAERVDGTLDKVNGQLALLGYYEAERVGKDFNEAYGYMRNAEKKAVKDAADLASQLIDDLGLDRYEATHGEANKNGKRKTKPLAVANIAPAGGDVTMHLPLAEGRELYVNIQLAPSAGKGITNYDGDNLEVTGVMCRVENPSGKGNDRYGQNMWFAEDVTYDELLKNVQRVAYRYIPERTDVVEGEYRVGDKVQYSPDGKTWRDAVVAQPNELGGIRIDTGLAPVMWVNATPEQLRHKPAEATAQDVPQSERKKKDGQAAAAPKENGNFAKGQQVGDLFAGLFNEQQNNNDNGQLERNRGQVRAQGVRADNSGQQQRLPESERGSGERTPQEGGRADTGRGGQGPVQNRTESAGLHGLKPQQQQKNTRNNHSERGEDHAPVSVDARIDANIRAIELARNLLESGDTATPEQMSVLRRYSGWGGLGSAFNIDDHSWRRSERNKKLRELLGPEAYEQAVMSANSAYYTPAYVVDTLWDIARQLGFKGGSILEGSAGIGNILGQMPTEISGASDIHAIEIDGTSGGILSLLYPDAHVDIQGFEKTRIPNGSVDLAITNVPFVTGLRVSDTTGDGDLSKKFHNIHDFCIAKNVRKLREGGIGIFISSAGTLDNSKALRDWVVNEGGSDFIGAFRMNNKTFGGTTVTSDIIVVRKRVNGHKSPQAIDVSTIGGERTAEYTEPGGKTKLLPMDYNKYFIEHPERMAGVMRFGFEEGDTYRPASKGLFPEEGKDQGRMLADFVSSLKEENEGEPAVGKAEETSVVRMGGKGHGKKVGEMFMKDGKVVVADSSHHYHELALNDKKIKGHTKEECFGAYTAIKDALSEVMKYQSENKDDAGLKPLLDKLNKAYDNFVSTYGHFNKNNQLAWLRSDVDYPNVFSLETYNEQGDGKGGVVKTYGKADVMKDRVVEKGSEPHPKNVKDGVVVSMFKNGRIDVPYIAGQLGRSEEDVTREIIGNGLGFENPTTRQVEVSFQYLSGNVREKLKQAEANNTNGEYDANIKALRDVVPMDIPSHLIDFSLGSSWLDPKLYEEYVEDRTGISVKFTTAGGTWYMDAPKYRVATQKNRAAGVTSEKLERTVLGHELIEAAIQNKTISMTKTKKHWDGTTETIVDRDATRACSDKIEEIRQDFKDWARQKMQADPELSGRIEREYNDRFNNYVPMKIPKEFAPEHFEGATRKLKMREHQSRAIVRGTMQPLMLAHEVGTGKTYTLISTAMEMRRLGTARKPMIVVQNATVGQFVKDAKELYPGAKILALGDSDRNAEGRRKFYAKIKYNDWDMVIVPQSAFEFIPDSEERQMQFIQDKIDEKMLVLEQMRKADTGGRDPLTRRAENELASLQADMAALTAEIERKRTGKNSGMTAAQEKKRAVAKQNTAVKAQEMLDRRTDDVENFDDMGIDALLVDEAHEYKHLGFSTAMQRGVKGVDPSYSKKSQGVYLKAQAVLEKSNGRNVIFATGTPISNTAAEIWTFMRYLMPKDTMKEYGIFYFDDFVRNFGNIQQMPEFTASGKFKEVNRFAGYVNLPELVRIWSSVADTVLTKDQKELANKIPDMEGGKAQDIYLPQTRALRSVMKYVKARLDEYDKMSGKEKKENSHIPLTMYGIAKAAAVDVRLVLADAEDDPHSKTNEAVRQTLRTLKETDGYKGTVAIFADNYQNKRSGFNLYEDIKKKLVAQGVPESEVVVMKPGMTIKKKQDIFDKVNRGEVRVVLGSTATLGTGVNIQERLHTLIHLDAPNRPMDYTQRNGRILRQGNLHKKWGKPVRVLRFGVEDSLDVTAYQRLKTKGAIADSIMEGEKLMNDSMNNRVLEEEEDVFGDTVAQLSGSEYALLKNNAEKNVRKYESRKRQWEADQIYIHNAKPRLEGLIRADEQRAEESKRQLQVVQGAFHGGKFKMITAGNNKFGSVEEMADFIKTHNKQVLADSNEMKTNASVGKKTKTLTLSVDGHEFKIKTELSKETTSAGGGLFSEVRRKMTYSCAELGLEDVPVKQGLLRNAVEDIADNVITGKDFAERLDAAEQSARHNRAELEAMKKREGKPFEFSKELEKSQQQLEEYTEAMKEELAEKERKYASMDASVEEAQDVAVDTDDTDDAADADEGKRFRLLDDDDPQAQELEALPESELVPVYRNVQVFDDDTLGSPMAFSDAATGERRTLEGGKWNYSEPREVKLTPEQQKQLDELNRNGYLTVNGKRTNELPIGGGLKFVKPKTKPAQLQYFLKKSPEDSGLWAAYNPYDHAIETPLNTQFGEAYKRPNLVVVRSLMPKSELEGHYMADYAKDSTGAHKWNNGRTLYLSRYSKIDKVLTREEEAQLIDEYWKKNPGKREALASHRDYRRFVPAVRQELEKMGYRFELDGKELTPEETRELDRQQQAEEPAIPGEEGRIPRVNAEDIARINAKMSGKWVGEPKETLAQAMVRRVKELAAKLGAKVRIVTSADELGESPTGRQRKMKGMYDTETGEITIVVGNHENLADVENTMLHEAVGHGGFRVLFDTKEKLGHAMDELYRVSGEKIRKWIDGKMRKLYDSEVDRIMARKRKEREAMGEKPSEHHLEDMAAAHIEASSKKDEFRRIATEEYGANLAGRVGEKGFEKLSAEEQTFWGRLKSMLQKALQRLSEGLNITGKHEWTDKDWAYVLHEAYKREKNGGKPSIFDKADTIAMRMRTGFGEGERKEEQRKSEGNIKQVNEKFNARLDDLSKNPNQKDRVLHLGHASQFLKNGGMADAEIILEYDKLQRKSKEGYRNEHPYDAADLKDLPLAIANPIAVFDNTNGKNSGNVILTELKKDGMNFIVAVQTVKQNRKGGVLVEVNQITTLFPKEAKGIVNWFNLGKATNIDKEKALRFIEALQNHSGTTIKAEELSNATKVIQDFKNSNEMNDLFSDDNPDDGMMFRDGDDDDIGDVNLGDAVNKMRDAAVESNANNLYTKREAMKAIGGNLSKLRQAMSRQKVYDKGTRIKWACQERYCSLQAFQCCR